MNAFRSADQYLKDSRLVRAIDRATVVLQQSWQNSVTGQHLTGLVGSFATESRRDRWSAIAFIVLTAVAVHVLVTIANSPPPGWFWMVIPALAALFAALVLTAARGSQSTE